MRPDIQRAFDHLRAGTALDPPPQSITELVALIREQTETYGDVEPRPPLSGVRCEPVDAGGVAAEWLIPDGDLRDCTMVYLHGGGWTAGSLNSHRLMVAAIASATGMPVLNVDYRLAPENPFPAGLDDSLTALRWAESNRPSGAGRPSRIFLGGDSCGGNLAAAACLSLVERGGRLPDRLVLVSPMLETACHPDRPDRGDPVASNDGIALVPQIYGIEPAQVDDPLVSPMKAPDRLLSGFPPTLIQASCAEFFNWDARSFTARLSGAGVRVTLSLWPEMPHVWHLFANLLPEAKAATEEIAMFLR